MKIGKVELNGNILLAPLAGFTDIGFRTLCKRYGASLTCTEMISAKGLLYGNEKTESLLATSENETPTCVQLFGSEPDVIAEAVKRLDFDIFDINMGCPVPKIVKNGEGSALMKNPALAGKIVEKAVRSTDSPVTVKCRIGFDQNDINVVEFAKRIEDAGASAITVHGRTREQFYSGKADWGVIEKVANAVNIPVIGNGDVTDKKSLDLALSSGVAGVMIGRGALGKPYIFSELRNEPYSYDVFSVAREHIAILKKYFNDSYVSSNMKKHLCRYLKGMRSVAKYKDMIFSATDTDGLLSVISLAESENK